MNPSFLENPGDVYSLFENAAAKFPENDYLVFLGRRFTYRETKDLIARAAEGLQKQGVKKGDRVGLLLPNTPHYVILFFAAMKIGAVIVNFNPLYAEREIANQIKDSRVRVMATVDVPAVFDKLAKVVDGTSVERVVVGQMADVLPFVKSLGRRFLDRKNTAKIPRDPRFLSFQKLLANQGKPQPVALDIQNDLALLQYTGGTTGVPKAAMLTHANLAANALQSRGIFPVYELGVERMMGVLPLCHIFALTVALNVTTAFAGVLILVPKFDVMDLIRTIDKTKPTLFPAVPSIFNAINHAKSLDQYDVTSIRYCISGGAPLPMEIKRTFEKLTGCTVVEGYGLTESSPVVSCSPIGGEYKEGSIGVPLVGTEVVITSMEDGESVMPRGERGEVCIYGPQVMRGYWEKPEETDGVLKHAPDGRIRLHTGDVGVMDADGYIFIVDRIKDMIAMGGFKIYPRNVEEVLYLHPAVQECVVAGIESPTRGQFVKAYIKLCEGQKITAPELREFLKDKLASHEIPKQIDFRDSLPKTAVGKLSRKLLVDEENAKHKKPTLG